MKINCEILLSEECSTPYIRVENDRHYSKSVYISNEIRLRLEREDKSLISNIQCSSHDIKHMIQGHLLAEGHIGHVKDIQKIKICKETACATVYMKKEITEYTIPTINTTKKYLLRDILACGPLLDSLSEAHHRTHGVHEGAIIKDGTLLAYAEDIGRHNVLDRLFSIIQTEQIQVQDTILVFSGRIPFSVITKVRKMGFAIICSRAVPTSLGIELAKKENMTLVSGLRFNSCNIFSHPERIIFE